MLNCQAWLARWSRPAFDRRAQGGDAAQSLECGQRLLADLLPPGLALDMVAHGDLCGFAQGHNEGDGPERGGRPQMHGA